MAAAGGALVAATVLGTSAAAVADSPPVQCPSRWSCTLTAQKPAKPKAAKRPVVKAPPLVNCIDPVTCVLPAVTPADVAQRAVKLLPLSGAEIGVAPNPDGFGLVGLPVWLWTEQTAQTWGPIQRTAAVEGLAVTARAQAQAITWDMGDGGQVQCVTPGTPYAAAYGNSRSPDCGYVYPHASTSRPGGVYALTATTRWLVTWWEVGGGGQTGTLTVTTVSQSTVEIRELQVVTQ